MDRYKGMKSIYDLSEHELMMEGRKLLKAMAERGFNISTAYVDEENVRLVIDTDEGTFYEIQRLIGEELFMLNPSDVTLKVPVERASESDCNDKDG